MRSCTGQTAPWRGAPARSQGPPRRPGAGGARAGQVGLYAPRVQKRSGVGCLVEVVETLVLTVIIFFVIQNFIAQPFQVQMQSMERTLEPGQYVLVDRLTPRWDPYKRGDVVVFTPPATWTTDPTPFIKRVIGLPGDRLELGDDGRVRVNGVALDEPYTYRNAEGVNEPTVPLGDTSSWVVPAGELFVMGDHRQGSADSRLFGPIPEASVIGRAFLRYWPLPTIGILQTPAYPGVPTAGP